MREIGNVSFKLHSQYFFAATREWMELFRPSEQSENSYTV